MSDHANGDPVIDRLRRDLPVPDDLDATLAEVQRAVRTHATSQTGRTRTSPLVPALATVVLGLIVSAVWFSSRPTPAQASLEEFAQVIEVLPAIDLGSREVLHITVSGTITESVVAVRGDAIQSQRSISTDRWVTPDGATVVVNTVGEAVFGDPAEAARALQLLGPEALETRTERFTLPAGAGADLFTRSWSGDPDVLRSELEDWVAGIEQEARLMAITETARDVAVASPLEPEVRAAVLRVLASTPGVDSVALGGGRRVTVVDARTSMVIDFDPDGRVTAYRTETAEGTLLEDVIVSSAIVDRAALPGLSD